MSTEPALTSTFSICRLISISLKPHWLLCPKQNWICNYVIVTSGFLHYFLLYFIYLYLCKYAKCLQSFTPLLRGWDRKFLAFFVLFFGLFEKGHLYVVRMSVCLKKTQFDSSVQWVNSSRLYCLIQRRLISLLARFFCKNLATSVTDFSLVAYFLLPPHTWTTKAINSDPQQPRTFHTWTVLIELLLIDFISVEAYRVSRPWRAVSNAANRCWLWGLEMTCICSLLGLGEFVLVAVVIVLAYSGPGSF